MLNIKNFPIDNIGAEDNFYGKTWEDLINERSVVKCVVCGKHIWSKWHKDFEFIDKCANCL